MQTNLMIKEIENKYPVEDITASGIPVWQFLRNMYAYELEQKHCPYSDLKKIRGVNYVKNALINYYWGKHNLVKHFSAVLFTDILEERIVNGKKIDKLAHNLITKMADEILIVLDPVGKKHTSTTDYFHSHYMSIYNFILPTKLKWTKYKINNFHVLIEIEKELDLQLRYHAKVNHFFHYLEIFKKWIQKTQPKIIFINCYFNLKHQALICAAKQNKIITVELQHGIISEAQIAYIIEKDIGRHTFPDYLLSFGEVEKKYVSENFLSQDKIIPIGNYYLEQMKDKNANQETHEFASSLRKKYNKIVLVSSQTLIETPLIEFMSLVARELPHTVFIFVPRRGKKISSIAPDLDNLLIQPDIDIYQFAPFCNYHSTVFSTFASESLFMGIPNIFININGLSASYFLDMFSGNPAVKFSNNVKSYVKIINEWNPPENSYVMKMSKELFVDSNNDVIKNLIDKTIQL